MKLKSALASLVLAGLVSGCYSVQQLSLFRITGKVTDSTGNARVVSADENVQFCVKINYTVSAKGLSKYAGSQTDCADIVTDQAGNFTVTRRLEIQSSEKHAVINVVSAKVFAKQTFSNGQSSQSVVISPNVHQIQVTPKGGLIRADLSLGDYSDLF